MRAIKIAFKHLIFVKRVIKKVQLIRVNRVNICEPEI